MDCKNYMVIHHNRPQLVIFSLFSSTQMNLKSRMLVCWMRLPGGPQDRTTLSSYMHQLVVVRTGYSTTCHASTCCWSYNIRLMGHGPSCLSRTSLFHPRQSTPWNEPSSRMQHVQWTINPTACQFPCNLSYFLYFPAHGWTGNEEC